MSEVEDSITQDHIKLVESINSRVDIIYKQLCEFEESIDPRTLVDYGDTQTKIMDLLENLEIIQEAAHFIRPHNLDLRSMQQSLNEQMICLEQSVDLLKLECKGSGKSDKMQD